MKKEIFNIVFLGIVVLTVAWLYWSQDEEPRRFQKDAPDSYILALSWQPAFCERKSNKPECRSQHERRFDANNFSLHGIWPQPRDNVYCDVPKHIVALDKRGRWNDLPKLEIGEKWRKELSIKMPGYRSNLHRHEWYKHGTCMGSVVTPLGYFRESMQKLDRINKSGLRDLFAENIGREINARQIAKIMDEDFGKGMGERISISCERDGKRTLINEIKVSYVLPDLDFVTSAEALVSKTPKLPIGCKRGIVDRVGLQ